MSLSAGTYSKRRARLALTEKRVCKILICAINSYNKIISQRVVFDYNDRGTYKKEDYLTSCFVDDYLQKELQTLNSSTMDYSIANTETTEKYTSHTDGKIHPDPIDIQVVDTALSNSLGIQDKVYFAIECKRIGSVSEYVKDTIKFTDRNYSKTRLPIEGQLGYIEKQGWDHKRVSKKINKNLSSNTKIKTIKNLSSIGILSGFDGTYFSRHEKKDKSHFSVYHLFFNYSNIVIN